MSTELTMLVYVSVLGIIQLLTATHFVTLQRGFKWNLSSREGKAADLTGVAGRLDRTLKNLLETLPFFMAAVLVVHISGRQSDLSDFGSQLYFYSRLIYFPLYAFGINGFRTLVWTCSMLGIALILFSCL